MWVGKRDHAMGCPTVEDKVDRWTQTPAREDEEDKDEGWFEELEQQAIPTTNRMTAIRRELGRLEEMEEIGRLARVECRRRRNHRRVSGWSVNK